MLFLLRFLEQQKDQTINRVVKWSMEVPTTPARALSNVRVEVLEEQDLGCCYLLCLRWPAIARPFLSLSFFSSPRVASLREILVLLSDGAATEYPSVLFVIKAKFCMTWRRGSCFFTYVF